MPGWLQAFSKANPVTLLADATRGLMVGGPVAVPAVESLLYAAGSWPCSRRSRSAPQAPGVSTPAASSVARVTSRPRWKAALEVPRG